MKQCMVQLNFIACNVVQLLVLSNHGYFQLIIIIIENCSRSIVFCQCRLEFNLNLVTFSHELLHVEH